MTEIFMCIMIGVPADQADALTGLATSYEKRRMSGKGYKDGPGHAGGQAPCPTMSVDAYFGKLCAKLRRGVRPAMRSCLVLGSGRSGTSMLGGVLHDTGYYMGEALYPGNAANPKGFFENSVINGINEEILSQQDTIPTRWLARITKKHTIKSPGHEQRWLMAIEPETRLRQPSQAVLDRIRKTVDVGRSFAYKDPRFSYTLPVWEPFLPGDAAFVCVFRSPSVTIESMLEERKTARYLRSFRLDAEDAEKVWTFMYQHIMKHYEKNRERFAFVHYDQLLNGSAFARLSSLLDARIQSSFPDPQLKRTLTNRQAGAQARAIYASLCELAGHKNP